MAQISITLAPTLSVALTLAPTLGVALTLTGGGATVTVISNGSSLTLAQSVPLVVAALYEFLRGPPGANGTAGIEVPLSWGDATPKAVVTAPAGKLVYGVQIAISEAFDGVGASLAVGDSGQFDRLMGETQNDPTVIGTYLTSPVHRYGGSSALSLAIAPGVGATAGRGLLTVFIEH